MTIPPTQEATSEERIFAAASHGSALLFGWGLVVPLVVWISQREKSRFAAFHAIQAMLFQLTQMIFIMAVMLVMMLLMFAFMFGAVAISGTAEGSEPPMAIFFVQFLMMGGMFCAWAIYPAIGILAAILTLAGKSFRYPLLGAWLERYLSKETTEVTS